MLATAFAIFFGIRYDLKNLKTMHLLLAAEFRDHINKYHGGQNGE